MHVHGGTGLAATAEALTIRNKASGGSPTLDRCRLPGLMRSMPPSHPPTWRERARLLQPIVCLSLQRCTRLHCPVGKDLQGSQQCNASAQYRVCKRSGELSLTLTSVCSHKAQSSSQLRALTMARTKAQRSSPTRAKWPCSAPQGSSCRPLHDVLHAGHAAAISHRSAAAQT